MRTSSENIAAIRGVWVSSSPDKGEVYWNGQVGSWYIEGRWGFDISGHSERPREITEM